MGHYDNEMEELRKQKEEALKSSIKIQIAYLPLEDLQIIEMVTSRIKHIKIFLTSLKSLLRMLNARYKCI